MKKIPSNNNLKTLIILLLRLLFCLCYFRNFISSNPFMKFRLISEQFPTNYHLKKRLKVHYIKCDLHVKSGTL